MPLRRPRIRHQSMASRAHMVIPAHNAASINPAVRNVRRAKTEALNERGTRKATMKNIFAAWKEIT